MRELEGILWGLMGLTWEALTNWEGIVGRAISFWEEESKSIRMKSVSQMIYIPIYIPSNNPQSEWKIWKLLIRSKATIDDQTKIKQQKLYRKRLKGISFFRHSIHPCKCIGSRKRTKNLYTRCTSNNNPVLFRFISNFLANFILYIINIPNNRYHHSAHCFVFQGYRPQLFCRSRNGSPRLSRLCTKSSHYRSDHLGKWIEGWFGDDCRCRYGHRWGLDRFRL